jgi:60 kDa SS-A/Ro ribonucleoprotein
MANKSIFKSFAGKLVPATNARNEENSPAYALSPKHALAQYAATGCMNDTFYAGAEDQVKKVLALCHELDATFIAKTAIFCRQRGFMKDMPALLCAVLAAKDSKVLQAAFGDVIDNGKMLRNFVQIVRSGIVGRKSLGTVPKKLVQRFLENCSDEALFKASIGQDPSLADVIKMVHPKPATESRAALYAYLIDRKHNAEALPELVKQFEAFKAKKSGKVPEVPFQMLTALDLGKNEWIQIARTVPWQMTRMNLNTFARHGVFEVKEMTKLIANRLRDAQAIKKARVFPYQLMTAYVSADAKVPKEVREALQDAMEIALQNVPRIDGQVYVFPDVSGSMSSPATGFRAGSTTAVRCIDVAALVAAAIVRKNSTAEVLPFESHVVDIELNPRDTVLTNAAKLAGIGGGGTNCSAPLAQLNRQGAKGDLVVFISDNESWVDAKRGGRGTATMQEWTVFKRRNPNAKFVCIDIQPYATTQAGEREDILNIGGFSDQVFEVINEFAAGRLSADHWIGVIEKVKL